MLRIERFLKSLDYCRGKVGRGLQENLESVLSEIAAKLKEENYARSPGHKTIEGAGWVRRIRKGRWRVFYTLKEEALRHPGCPASILKDFKETDAEVVILLVLPRDEQTYKIASKALSSMFKESE